MDELIRLLNYEGGQGDQIHMVETCIAMLLSLGCSYFIANLYRATHRGTGYSQTYTQSLVLLSLVTTLVMIVIGSNIARAFSLVGALSIIRFRNAIKETRDVAFIFFAMAVAMACGTRFYTLAILATLFNGMAVYGMTATNFGKMTKPTERLLTVQLPPGHDPETTLHSAFGALFQNWNIVSMESVRQGLFQEIVYSVEPLPNVKGTQVLDSISKVNGNLKISYNYSSHTDGV